MVKELCNIEEVIKKKGYRLTDPRRAVFEAITERPEVYLSADDIHEFAKKKKKTSDLPLFTGRWHSWKKSARSTGWR